MKNEILINTKTIKDKIYFIRNQKVMLDKDLAEIYHYEVKRLNEQVKRNIDRFPEDFMFQLTKDEIPESSKSQFATLNEKTNKRGTNIKKMPYAFTEQGIYMLMTILKGDLAIKQSIALIKLFKTLKDYANENGELILQENIMQIEYRTSKLETKVDDMQMNLNTVMDNFVNPSLYKHFLIMNGKKIEADMAYIKIYRLARKSIYCIDNYVDIKTLDLLSHAKNSISITLFTDNITRKTPIKQYMIDDFRIQNPSNDIIIKRTNNKYHDRYIIIDYRTRNEKIYHCGSSSKDAGNKITTIYKIEDSKLYKPMIEELLNNADLILQ